MHSLGAHAPVKALLLSGNILLCRS